MVGVPDSPRSRREMRTSSCTTVRSDHVRVPGILKRLVWWGQVVAAGSAVGGEEDAGAGGGVAVEVGLGVLGAAGEHGLVHRNPQQ